MSDIDTIIIRQKANGSFEAINIDQGDLDVSVITIFLRQGDDGGVPEPVRRARCISRVNIRSGPGTSFADIGDLLAGAVVEVLEAKTFHDPMRIWYRIGHKQWAAKLYAGTVFLEDL